MKNKTINDVAILRTVEGLLIDGHASQETLEFKKAMIPDPALHKVEFQKKENEKTAGREYKIDVNAIPKIDGLEAVRTISYPSSGFAALKVNEQLKIYESLSEKEKEKITTVEVA